MLIPLGYPIWGNCKQHPSTHRRWLIYQSFYSVLFFTIFITMKTMDIIFDDLDHYGELLADIDEWNHENGLPRAKTIIDVVEDNVDGIGYYVITVNETIFSYLMLREFDMTEKYGRDGWNGYIESTYNCQTA